MNSILRYIALVICVALTLSATTGTFSSTTKKNASTSSAVQYTNGWVVTLKAAGWIYGDAITASTTPTITWTTLTANTASAVTGIGLVAATCTTKYTSTTATLVGQAATAGCPADFTTVYTAAPTAATTTTIAPIAPASSVLTVDTPVRWTLTAPATSSATTIVGISVKNGGATEIAVTDPTAAKASSGAAAQQYAIASLSYAFYVETAGTNAVVCFQTAAQHTASTSCGSVVTSSAGILSATISGFVAMIALIFFN